MTALPLPPAPRAGRPLARAAALAALALLAPPAACARGARDDAAATVTFAGSAVGAEGAVLARQVARFERARPGVRVRVTATPDDGTQRHQLYVQWLNARVADPDVLQLDVVWTAEFAAAGWLAPLDARGPDTAAFFPAAVRANRWGGALYALPWFVDVGMLYWRTDLLDAPPDRLDALAATAARAAARAGGGVSGIVWQGARYEGLVTVFLEYLGGTGGEILTADGEVAVDSPAAVRALTLMREQIGGAAPADVLTWHEEETRFAFQGGRAALMRNWPYAAAPLADAAVSRVAGRFAVAPMPAAPGGRPTAALGGQQLAVSANSDAPRLAWELVAFLTAPAQMLERARVTGQYPARPALFDDPALAAALPVPPAAARAVVERAVPRPVTPVWSQLSELLQIELHRALAGQAAPAEALGRAARGMRAVIARTRVRELAARPAP